MDESEDILLKNKDKLIKSIRLIGVIFFVIGFIFLLFEAGKLSASIFCIMGLFQIFAAPRVLEWVVQMRNRGIDKNGE
jgi:hypothetical protein